MGRRVYLAAALVALIGTASLYPFLKDPRPALERAISNASYCTSDDDCTILQTTCPLGCYHAVPKDQLDTLHATADRLLRRYEILHKTCAYDCMAPADVVCQANRCVFAQ